MTAKPLVLGIACALSLALAHAAFAQNPSDLRRGAEQPASTSSRTADAGVTRTALAGTRAVPVGRGGPAMVPGEPASAPGTGRFQYVSPLPGSQLVSRWNNIVIRQGGSIDATSFNARSLSVIGSASGFHSGRLVLSDDSKTLVFRPESPFALGETVLVSLQPGVRAVAGECLPPLSFNFSVSARDPREAPSQGLKVLDTELPAALLAPTPSTDRPRPGSLKSLSGDALPPNYPAITVLTSDDPEPGGVFFAPFSLRGGSSYLMIVDNLGMPLYYRELVGLGRAFDFKLQPNGLLTYWESIGGQFYALDSTYAVVDSFAMGNGYTTDLHDLQLLPNGHALLMCYDGQPVDMSTIVPGGNPNATVVGLILQELDAAKNVVFQWRSWDHFAITDCVSATLSMTGPYIDYVHGNAVELDQDGNLMLSSRHMNEITKIDRQTGDILWRLGLNAKNNQFTFVNDTRGFSHQHDIRRLPNGHITLFDNGNYLTPEYSRAVEYDLDEVNMVATQVWEFRNSPDTYGGFMGNVQRRASGGTMIGWGGTVPNPKLSDIHADGSKGFELAFMDSTGLLTYRAFRFPWQTTRFVTNLSSMGFDAVEVGRSAPLDLTVSNPSRSEVTLTGFISTEPSFSVPATDPITIAPGGSANIRVVFAPTSLGVHRGTLYLRQVTDHELVAQVVDLWGRGKSPIRGRGGAVASSSPSGTLRFELEGARPNPVRGTTTLAFELPRDGRIRLEVLDVHGRKMDTVVDEFRAAGSYSAVWTAKSLANGIYFFRLEAGNRVATRKFALMQ